MSNEPNAGDLVASPLKFLMHWSLPIAAMVGAIWLDHPVKTLIWTGALTWMGTACLWNARKCGRTHCYYTGPFFFFMVIPVALHGFSIVSLGSEGWKWLGAAVGLGSWAIWTHSERKFGTYS